MADKTVNVNIKYNVDTTSLNRAQAASKAAQDATDKLRKSTNDYSTEVKKVTADATAGFSNLRSIVSSISFVGLIGGLAVVAKKIFDIGVANQQLKITFETMLGSAEKAKKVMAELTKFSIETPFTPDQVNKAAKALLAFDLDAKKLIPTLKFLGDVSSATGKDLAEMAVIFGQIKSTGRLMGQDLLQLINAGFNPLQQISKETGRSVAQLKVEMEKGLISFDMVEKAFISVTSEGGRFFDLMDKQSATIGGQLSTIEGNIEEIAKKLFEAREGPLAAFIEGIAKLTSNTDKNAKALNNLIDLLIVAPTLGVNIFNAISADAEKSEKVISRLRKEQLELDLAIAKGDLETVTGQKRLETIKKIFDIEKELGRIKIIPLEDPLGEDNPKKQEERIGIIEALRKKIAELGKEIEQTTNKGDLGGTGKLVLQLKSAQKELDILLGKDKEKRKKDSNEVQEYLAYLSDLDLEQTKGQLKAKQEQRENDAKHEKEAAENTRDHLKKVYEKRKEDAEELAAREKELREDVSESIYNNAQALIGSLLQGEADEYSQRLYNLRNFYDEQMLLAGDNKRAKDQLKLQEERETQTLEKRRADREKKAAQAGILVNTALAIIKIFAGEGTYVDKLIRAGIMAGEGATQYTIASRARYYAKGEINIKGPGSESSDSIPAMLSKGESIMTAKQTREAFGILTDVRAGKLNDRVLKQLITNGGSQMVMDDSRIVEAIKGQPKPPDLVRNGRQIYEVYTDQQNNKRFIRSKSI